LPNERLCLAQCTKTSLDPVHWQQRRNEHILSVTKHLNVNKTLYNFYINISQPMSLIVIFISLKINFILSSLNKKKKSSHERSSSMVPSAVMFHE
jgi:hypothetical protein